MEKKHGKLPIKKIRSTVLLILKLGFILFFVYPTLYIIFNKEQDKGKPIPGIYIIVVIIFASLLFFFIDFLFYLFHFSYQKYLIRMEKEKTNLYLKTTGHKQRIIFILILIAIFSGILYGNVENFLPTDNLILITALQLEISTILSSIVLLTIDLLQIIHAPNHKNERNIDNDQKNTVKNIFALKYVKNIAFIAKISIFIANIGAITFSHILRYNYEQWDFHCGSLIVFYIITIQCLCGLLLIHGDSTYYYDLLLFWETGEIMSRRNINKDLKKFQKTYQSIIYQNNSPPSQVNNHQKIIYQNTFQELLKTQGLKFEIEYGKHFTKEFDHIGHLINNIHFQHSSPNNDHKELIEFITLAGKMHNFHETFCIKTYLGIMKALFLVCISVLFAPYTFFAIIITLWGILEYFIPFFSNLTQGMYNQIEIILGVLTNDLSESCIHGAEYIFNDDAIDGTYTKPKKNGIECTGRECLECKDYEYS